MKKVLYVLVIIVAVFIGGTSTFFVMKNYGMLKEDKEENIKAVTQTVVSENDSIANSVDKVYDSVVAIKAFDNNNILTNIGTGFYFKKTDDKAYIVTNYHVIENSKIIKIINNNDNEKQATLVASDKSLDIAVLSTNGNNVNKIANFGVSSNTKVGDTIFTIGTPIDINYKGTVSKGILSGKNRTAISNSVSTNLLQVNVSTSPGNSGGPLLNLSGDVIGIMTLKMDENDGIGFAISSEDAISYINKLNIK